MALWLHKTDAPDLREMIAVFDGLSQLTAIAAGLQRQFELNAPISIGAGINTGWAAVGNFGSIASADYTALGDVVNKAFRLESATKEILCDVALGEETYGFLAGVMHPAPIFQCRTVKLKGYGEPATAYGARLSALPAVLEALRRARESLE